MKRNGYSLVEVSVIVVIVGILGGIAIFSWQNMGKNDLETYAKELASDLLWARFSAINNGVYYKISFWTGNQTKKWEYIIKEGSKLKTLKKGYFKSGIHILGVNFPGWGINLLFYPNGSPSSGGTVTISDKMGNLIYVKVEAAVGRIRVTDKDE